MKKLYILLLILPLIGFGQGWEQTYPSHMGSYQTVSQTSDGGYITGMSVGVEWEDQEFFLLKLDQNGNEEWSTSLITGIGSCGSVNIIVEESNDGGYFGVVSGYCVVTDPFINQSFTKVTSIFKTDDNGNILWINQPLSLVSVHSISQSSDDNYVIVGNYGIDTYYSIGTLIVLKLDNDGNEIWSQNFEGWFLNLLGGSLEETYDGGCVLMIKEEYVSDTITLIKLDQMGNIEWENYYNEFSDGDNYYISNTFDGGFIIGGLIPELDDNGWLVSSVDLVLIKIDGNGVQESITSLNYPGPDFSYFSQVQQTSDGGYIVLGSTNGGPCFGSSNIVLKKIDVNGNQEWSQLFNNGSFGFSVQELSDGGFIIGGQEEVNCETEYLLYIIKTDSNGNISTIELPTPTGKRELIKTTNILGQENTTIKNQPMIEIYDDGSVEKKYIVE